MSKAVAGTSKSTLFVVMMLRFYLKAVMNHLLSSISSLSIVTHQLLINLSYPALLMLYFSYIFEFVSFDLIPTDDFYDYIFGFQNEPFSSQAEELGYESHNLIRNMGSLFLTLLLTPLFLLVG